MGQYVDVAIVSMKRVLGRVRFSGPRFRIGRDPRAELYLNDRRISRLHATILHTDEGFVLEDNSSSNGTMVNDRPWTTGALCDGDMLTIGRFDLVIELGVRPDDDEEPHAEIEVLGGDKGMMQSFYGSRTTIRID
jgi:pSer/pThr/pTyr-binding forkhead associated (FHA) protein